MTSIAFPYFLNGSKVILNSDIYATNTNLKLVLSSSKNTLFGDPEFGSKLRQMLFEQNSVLIQDRVIDEIYTSIKQFIPQIRVLRSDIQVKNDGSRLYVSLKYTNLQDFTVNEYELDLMN